MRRGEKIISHASLTSILPFLSAKCLNYFQYRHFESYLITQCGSVKTSRSKCATLSRVEVEKNFEYLYVVYITNTCNNEYDIILILPTLLRK